MLDPDTPEHEARAYWMGPGVAVYVADAAGDIVGTYALRANQRGLGSHVANAGFMVRADQMGRGLGRMLGAHALDEARAAGFRAMQFNAVVSTNRRAVTLWRRLGFDIIGSVPWGFRHPTRGFVDLHIMYRVL
jgi:GNAT superfamily N-acetyltransferase